MGGPCRPARGRHVAEQQQRKPDSRAERLQDFFRQLPPKTLALLTSEFVWMHGTGEVATKEQLIESFRTGRSSYRRDDIDSVNVTLYGEAAVVVGHNVRQLGSGEVLEFRYTTTYVKQDGSWRIAVFHSSHCPCKQ